MKFISRNKSCDKLPSSNFLFNPARAEEIALCHQLSFYFQFINTTDSVTEHGAQFSLLFLTHLTCLTSASIKKKTHVKRFSLPAENWDFFKCGLNTQTRKIEHKFRKQRGNSENVSNLGYRNIRTLESAESTKISGNVFNKQQLHKRIRMPKQRYHSLSRGCWIPCGFASKWTTSFLYWPKY